ncbi:MAG: polysaccharide deacetylase [Brevundimonas sp.]|nr:MAG: polysaccharide deacetylase [Brevundimonas sp.]
MFLHRLLIAFAAMLALAAPVAAQERRVAVTFDDLPFQATEADQLCDPARAMAFTRAFLDMLEPLDSHATGFVNEGQVCEATRQTLLPNILDAWLDAGIGLGNHTFSHLDINTVTAEAWLDNVDQGAIFTRQALERQGLDLVWFRHPYLHAGDTAAKKAAAEAGLAHRGYVIAPVTIDNSDWMFAGVYRKAEAAGDTERMRRIGEAYVAYMDRVLDFWEPYSAEVAGGAEPPQILLLHAHSLNRDWYPHIHALFLRRGYRFVTLEEAMADPLYRRADLYVGTNGMSWLHRWRRGDHPTDVRWEPEPPEWISKDTAAP